MKKYLALVTMLLLSLPSFGVSHVQSHGQPSRSSQFHVDKSRLSHKKSAKGAAHRPGDRHPSAPLKAENIARKGHFRNSVRGLSGVSAPSFLAGTRTPWGGQDDGESESVLGDFNGDGKRDVARVVTDTNGNPEISVLLSNGDGTFKTAVITALPADTDAPFLVGDLNGDGKDDLVLVQPYGGNCTRKPGALKPQIVIPCGAFVFVFLSDGTGGFAAPVIYPVTDASLRGGLLTDLNGDGKLDILAFDDSTPPT